MIVLSILCVALWLVTINAHYIPSPYQEEVLATCTPVGTTIIDNSLSNALANALELLIVSNLLDMAMKNSASLEALQASLAPTYDSVSIPAIDIIIPDCFSNIQYNEVPSCDSVIDITYYPDITPTFNCNYDFENNFIPICGCSIPCDCGYDNINYNMPFISNRFFDGSYNVAPDFDYSNNINCNFGYSNFIPEILLSPHLDIGYNHPSSYGCCNNVDYNSGYNNLLPNNINCNFGYNNFVPEIPLSLHFDNGYNHPPNYGCYNNIEYKSGYDNLLPNSLNPISFYDSGYNFPCNGYGNNLDYNFGYNKPFCIDCDCNFIPNCLCGCNGGNIPPNSLSPFYLPNIDCGCSYGCNQCLPIITEIIYPAPFTIPNIYDFEYGVPNVPIEIAIEPCYDNFYNPYHSNGYFYK